MRNVMRPTSRELVAYLERSFPTFEEYEESGYTAEVDARPEQDEVARIPNSVTGRIWDCIEVIAMSQIQVDGEQKGQREVEELSIRHTWRASRGVVLRERNG